MAQISLSPLVNRNSTKKKVSKTSPLVAKTAVTREKQVVAVAEDPAVVAEEKCMMQSALSVEQPHRYHLNPRTTDQSTAVIATKLEGNPRANGCLITS